MATNDALLQFLVSTEMARIEPFRALRYDPARVVLWDVATQPYDKITPEMQERYYLASPYNLVRIILGKRSATDNAENNVYTRAAGFFAEWRRQGIFLQDSQPSLYRYVQRFTVPGASLEMERQGFIALGKIENYSEGVIFPHERTLAKPKADRLDLLRATKAHFGQIFMLYSDPAEEIENSLVSADAAVIDLRDEYGVLHQLWRVSEPDVIALVRRKMLDKKLIIADGHHRYETALNYRNERRSSDDAATAPHPGTGELAPHELVMMTFVNMDSPGLRVLPTHRVVHGLPDFSVVEFRDRAKVFFSVEEADGSINAARATVMLREAAHTGTSLLAVTRDRAFLLSRSNAPPEIFSGTSLRQQGLDVVQLHKCLLERALGISEEAIRNQQNVTYVRDAS